MNINEVNVLSRNLREVYRGSSDPHLGIQIGDHVWYYDEDKITERSFSYTPQELSERLFYWVK